MPLKVLIYGESPCISTGLAQVSRNIIDPLLKDGHEIEVVAINHFLSDYDHERYPYLIHSCPVDDCTNENIAVDRIMNGDFDIFLYSSDFGRYSEIFNALGNARNQRNFYSIAYCPVDCDIIPSNTFDCLELFNVRIVYTEHAKAVIDRMHPGLCVNVIGLACEPDRYYPLSIEEKRQARKDLFSIEDDNVFLCLSNNRNQPRKDLGRLMMIFHEFHKAHELSVLYMHCKQNDVGGSVPTMAFSLEMQMVGENAEIIFAPENFSAINGYNWSIMNRIYNAADCLLSTSTGEGWGLSTTEAMAAGIPVIVPRNTAFIEIVGSNEERGYLVKSGGDLDHMMFPYGMSANNPRDMVHVASFLEKLEYVCGHRQEAQEKAAIARAWTLERDKEVIGKQWRDLFGALEASPIAVKEVSNVN